MMKTCMRRKLAGRLPADQRGQSLVEFTLMIVVLMVILMGILDLGRLYFAYVALQNAAGEGATYAAINPVCFKADSGPDCADPNNITWRTKNESPAGIVVSDSIGVQVLYDTHGITLSAPITVNATYNFKLVTFVISSIVQSDTLPLRAQASSAIQVPVSAP